VADIELGSCDVCRKEPAVGVAAVPAVPISVAYGRACLQANAHPYFVIVANTANIGGLDQAADFWVAMVEDTLKHLEIPREKFDADVEQAIREEMERYG
jgi:hypothetical protein